MTVAKATRIALMQAIEGLEKDDRRMHAARRRLRWMRRAAAGICMALSCSTGGGATVKEWATFGIRATNDPRPLIVDAQRDLQAAQASGSREEELWALYRLVEASDVTTVNDYAAIRKHLPRALELARELGNSQALARLMIEQAAQQRREGDEPAGEKTLAQARDIAQQSRLDDVAAMVDLTQGSWLMEAGRSAQAIDSLIKAANVFEATHSLPMLSVSLQEVGIVYYQMPGRKPQNLRLALKYYERSLAALVEGEQPFAAFAISYSIGRVHFELKDMASARKYFERALNLASGLGNPVTVAKVQSSLAQVDLAEGHARSAMEQLGKALPVLSTYSDPAILAMPLLTQARAAAQLSQWKASAEALNRAEALMLQFPARFARDFHDTAAWVDAAQGHYESAYEHMRKLREADMTAAVAANEQQVNELQARLDLQHEEAENAMLRSQQREAESRRWITWLLLGVGLVALAAGVLSTKVRRLDRLLRSEFAARQGDPRDDELGRDSILEFAGSQMGHPQRRLCLVVIDIRVANPADASAAPPQEVVSGFYHRCRRLLRPTDRLGRYGATRLLVVMPGAELSATRTIQRRMCEDMALFGDGRWTLAVGVAAAVNIQDTLDQVLQRACEALQEVPAAHDDLAGASVAVS